MWNEKYFHSGQQKVNKINIVFTSNESAKTICKNLSDFTHPRHLLLVKFEKIVVFHFNQKFKNSDEFEISTFLMYSSSITYQIQWQKKETADIERCSNISEHFINNLSNINGCNWHMCIQQKGIYIEWSNGCDRLNWDIQTLIHISIFFALFWIVNHTKWICVTTLWKMFRWQRYVFFFQWPLSSS